MPSFLKDICERFFSYPVLLSFRSGLKGEDGDSVLPKLDENYVREMKKNHDAKLDKLEHDLKNYKSNSIKESIR